MFDARSLHFTPLWHQHFCKDCANQKLWAFFLDKKHQEALSNIFNIAKKIYYHKKP